jgi:RimJ/RimL family protein N-acetyltransferase
MIELHPDKFPALLAALQSVPINTLFARSVLEQRVAGTVWADRSDHPSLVHVVHPYGMALLFGDAGATSPAVLRMHLLAMGENGRDQWLQVSPEALFPLLDALLDVESVAPDQQPGGPRIQRYTRTNFKFNPARHALKRGLIPPHDEFMLRPLLAAEFALPDIDVSPHKFWTSAGQFLAHGGGWCLERDGRLASMAFSSFRFDHQLEIGVETRAQYRGRNYAFYAACALIDQCTSQGLEPVWSCRKENKGSYKLALALGFEPTIEIPYYRLPGARVLG